jgi:hypothetical protein
MEQFMKVSGKIMKLQATDTTNGVMAVDISVIGKATLWMISVFILGKMVECMKDFTETTRNTGMACTRGQIRKSTLDGGTKVNSMV